MIAMTRKKLLSLEDIFQFPSDDKAGGICLLVEPFEVNYYVRDVAFKLHSHLLFFLIGVSKGFQFQ
jgi:hypothetical protein